MPTQLADLHDVETPIFDGAAAQKGYGLNAMCYAFNSAERRARFVADPEAVFKEYGLTEPQRDAVRRRDVTAMIREGGNAYYLLKLANLAGMDVQDIGAQQTGVTRAEFQAKLRAAAGA
jgi:protocatechuate 4,5-dioxygenase alpha chain